MKKLFLAIVMAVAAFSAQAQIYVGGEAGFWRDYDNNKTSVKLYPEIGYNLDEKWSVGTKIGYEYDYGATTGQVIEGIGTTLKVKTKTHSFIIAPYARYIYAKFGPVNLFLDGGFSFFTYKEEIDGQKEDAKNAWEVGVKPGLSVNLTEKLSFVSHVGFLGWRDSDGSKIWDKEGFGFDLSGNSLTFGLYYNF